MAAAPETATVVPMAAPAVISSLASPCVTPTRRPIAPVTPETPAALSARGLTVTVKHRGVTKTLLDDVGFDVPEQALVAVIGPSGSGKSTLLRALTGSRPADSGERPLRRPRPVRRVLPCSGTE